MAAANYSPPIRIDLSKWALALPLVVLAAAVPVVATLRSDVAANTVVQIFVVLYVVMAIIDAATYKIPNLVVYPAIAFALLSTAIIDVNLLPEALVGGGVALLLMFIVALVGRGAMGMGDVKVACFTGCAHGLAGGFLALGLGFVIGMVIAIPVLLLRLRNPKDSMPLTPFFAAGAVIYGLYFHFLLTRYLG